jgi:hypothetical protein
VSIHYVVLHDTDQEVESVSGTTASGNGEFTRMARMQRVRNVTEEL